MLTPTASSPSASSLSEAGMMLTKVVPPPGTMPSSTAARVACDGVLDAVLLLLELRLGGRADLDDGDAAGQLGQALLELLPVVVGVGLLDLPLDELDAALDGLLVAVALDDGRLFLGRCGRGGPGPACRG